MSFLNPVSEPVLRFSSTDADAPQINYNARVAGDVKTVIKACLVTGYGDKASAGWSIANEVDYVAEFVSPSAAMSDYRLGIDDSSASKTQWYYHYQDARTDPSYNDIGKSFRYVNKTHISNGWELLVSERGLFWVEIVTHETTLLRLARITYMGAVKSALAESGGINFGYFNTGYESRVSMQNVFSDSYLNYRHYRIEQHQNILVSAINIKAFTEINLDLSLVNIDMISPVYLSALSRTIAQQPGLMLKTPALPEQETGSGPLQFSNRPYLAAVASTNVSGVASNIMKGMRTFLIPLDYWEY